jgi:hypothetical protein
MVTGGFKTRQEAADAVSSGAADVVGLARTLALEPTAPAKWLDPAGGDPEFPRFTAPPPGGITAWFTMRLDALGNNAETTYAATVEEAVASYDSRDDARVAIWEQAFGQASSS